MTRTAILLGSLIATVACSTPRTRELVYFHGRAVAMGPDSLLAFTSSDTTGVIVLDPETGVARVLGQGYLHSPVHVQYERDRWYVSDMVEGIPSVVVLTRDGALERRLDLDGVSALPHQFGVLPDGRVVVQAMDNRLIAHTADSVTTFTLTEVGARPSLIVAAGGGILHAVPDHHLSLYNGLGHIRWRIEWPWRESAFISDIAVDRQGRIHVLSDGEEEGTFVVFTIVPETGEIDRWSTPGPYATFVVNIFGAVLPDSADHWIPAASPSAGES